MCSRQGYLQFPWGDVFYCNSLHHSVACKEWKHFPKWGCSSLPSHSSPLLLLQPEPDTHPRPMAKALLKAHQNASDWDSHFWSFQVHFSGSGLLFHGPQLARGSLFSTYIPTKGSFLSWLLKIQNSARKNSLSEGNHSKPEFKFHTYRNVPKIDRVNPGVRSDQNRWGYSRTVQLQVQGVVRAGERAKGSADKSAELWDHAETTTNARDLLCHGVSLRSTGLGDQLCLSREELQLPQSFHTIIPSAALIFMCLILIQLVGWEHEFPPLSYEVIKIRKQISPPKWIN